MARDFEDLHGIDDLSDDELKELVRTHLAAHNMLDVDDISVSVADGVVRLAGRVGTDGERRVAEHVVTDTLGIVSVANEIVVDPIRRAESPMAIDEHLAEEERTEGLLLGDKPRQHNDEAVPLDDESNIDERLWGTTDVSDTISAGTPWIPPESPTPEGMSGTDADLPDMREDH
jgi:hypothetical protein